MRFYSRPIKSAWLKAAAIGSFWGATEIILGSYLHNLHVPMAGAFMSFFVIVLLSIFTYFWNDSGLALKSSLIAALIKSISPSAVLFGPMTAIILEGFLFEVGITIFGRNLLGFLIAGILTEMSIVVHKILSLLIIYGLDIVKIAENFYIFLVKLLHIRHLNSIQALLLIFVLFGLIGALGAVIGYFYAREVKQHYSKADVASFSIKEKKLFEFNEDKSVWLKLVLNIVLTAFLIWSLKSLPFQLSVAFILVVWALFYSFYPQAFRYFKKPGLWIQLAVFWVLAVLFYVEFNAFQITLDAIIIGLKLIFRALVIIIFFSILSIQIRTPLIKSFLLRRGFNNLYLTLKLASSTLPRFVEAITKNKISVSFFKKMIYSTINLVDFFEQKIIFRKLFIIQGDRNSGKTKFMQQLSEYLNQMDLSLGGIITIKKIQENIIDYYVKDINTGIEVLLCTNRKLNDYYFKTHNFYFTHEGVKFGNQVLKDNVYKLLLLIDEVGVLELRDMGWASTLETLFSLRKNMIWAVRKRYVNQVLWKFYVNQAIIFDITIDTPKLAAITIAKQLFK